MRIADVKKLAPLDRLLYWIQEREKVRLLKESGAEKPWTDDEILQSYRFCNARRMDDKVSQWLLHNWYSGVGFDHSNILYACALARFINLPSSLERIGRWVFRKGEPEWDDVKEELRALKLSGPIFNAAYMVRGNDGMDKVECVVDYYVRPLKDVRDKLDPDFMELTWSEILHSYGMGSFMAGQIVADLRWAMSGSWLDRNDWAPIGPGSRKGMNVLQGRRSEAPLTQQQFLEELRELRDVVEERLPEISSRLEMHDIQNCCCEYWKYSKCLAGLGNPKQKYPGGIR